VATEVVNQTGPQSRTFRFVSLPIVIRLYWLVLLAVTSETASESMVRVWVNNHG
jgi:hypothetical protein